MSNAFFKHVINQIEFPSVKVKTCIQCMPMQDFMKERRRAIRKNRERLEERILGLNMPAHVHHRACACSYHKLVNLFLQAPGKETTLPPTHYHQPILACIIILHATLKMYPACLATVTSDFGAGVCRGVSTSLRVNLTATHISLQTYLHIWRGARNHTHRIESHVGCSGLFYYRCDMGMTRVQGWFECLPDMRHGTDCPYPIRIFAFFEMIRPYHVGIRISGNLRGKNCKDCV